MYNIEDEIIKFRHRAKFGAMSYVYIVLFIFSAFMTIGFFRYNLVIFGLFGLFLDYLFLNLMFNIRGVEIDLTRKIITTYKKVLWLRISKSYNLDDFKTIRITQDCLNIRTTRWADHRSDNYYYYYINLVNNDTNRTLILAESQDYREIAHASEALAFQLNVEVVEQL